jgi:hypothetical protein
LKGLATIKSGYVCSEKCGRHRHIQHDQVRFQLLCFLNGINAIRRFTANFEALGLKEKPTSLGVKNHRPRLP